MARGGGVVTRWHNFCHKVQGEVQNLRISLLPVAKLPEPQR